MGIQRGGSAGRKKDKLLIYKKKSTLKMKKKKKVKVKAKNVNQIYRNATRSAKAAILTEQPQTIPEAAKLAITAAKIAVKGQRPSKQILHDGLPRIIPVPKIGNTINTNFCWLICIGRANRWISKCHKRCTVSTKCKKETQRSQTSQRNYRSDRNRQQQH